MKTDFSPYPVGTIFNPVRGGVGPLRRATSSVTISFPSRLNAMALDPAAITSNNNLIYTPGEIAFCVDVCRTIRVSKVVAGGGCYVPNGGHRVPLIHHAFHLMQSTLEFDDGLEIEVIEPSYPEHCGLGSSSALIAGVSCAINQLYGRPISHRHLIRYLAQNHGEAIVGNPDLISPVQCIGGSAAAGMCRGGVLILAGESAVIGHSDLPPKLRAVIGIPAGFSSPETTDVLDEEIRNFPKFVETGRKYGAIIAYRLVHLCLPALVDGDIQPLADLIFDYRFDMGSITNCSFVHPPIVEIAKEIRFLKERNIVSVLSLSSVGPAFFALTESPDECERTFSQAGMQATCVNIHNSPYSVVGLES